MYEKENVAVDIERNAPINYYCVQLAIDFNTIL